MECQVEDIFLFNSDIVFAEIICVFSKEIVIRGNVINKRFSKFRKENRLWF